MILRRPLTEKLLEKYEKALNTEPVFTEYEQFRLKFETDLDELQKSELRKKSEVHNSRHQFTGERSDLQFLLDESSQSEDDDLPNFKKNHVRCLLKMHKYRKKVLKQHGTPNKLENYMYYGSGLLLEKDEHTNYLKYLKYRHNLLKKKRKEISNRSRMKCNQDIATIATAITTNVTTTTTTTVTSSITADDEGGDVKVNNATKCLDNDFVSDNTFLNGFKVENHSYAHFNGHVADNELITTSTSTAITASTTTTNISTSTTTVNTISTNCNSSSKCNNLMAPKTAVPSQLVTNDNIVLSHGKRLHMTREIEILALKRHKVYVSLIKRDLLKLHKNRINLRKDELSTCKKVAFSCQKNLKLKAFQSLRISKEALNRTKKLSREVQLYWRMFDRAERETERRLKKEVEEQRKIDVEMLEAKRQQRKLNFLITQTELYGHFISKKCQNLQEDQFVDEQKRILSQLDEDVQNSVTSTVKDRYDANFMKSIAEKNVMEAFRCENERTEYFNGCQRSLNGSLKNHEYAPSMNEFFPQPSLFKGVLKCYQLKGMNWLAKLYNQGINGILADEMGLGKTIQSIAFLCYIAENYGIWGPFLIISPASTLHNWQQELEKFAPDFKIVPYWGSPNDRKVLRQFWDPRGIQTKMSSFHIVVTSYQIVITDIKYFNKIRWQYMVLDEAQAIKSSSSIRWKLLLSFNCRNRLLLSGTPIQNSMAELWALLHFIMPTLFDCHEEFNEWFSKDIENHAEHRTGIDERHLSRLHMILKPFMLRRIKKDVENELSDKIEVMLYCPLSMRQQFFYTSLKKKILNEDLLCSYEKNPTDKNVASNLMNLVMQFRKVCNHPDLVERRIQKYHYFYQLVCYQIPKLLFDYFTDFGRATIPYSIYTISNIYYGLFRNSKNTFSFTRFLNISFQELHNLFHSSFTYRFKIFFRIQEISEDLNYRRIFWDYRQLRYLFFYAIHKPDFSKMAEFHYNIKFINSEFYKFNKTVECQSYITKSYVSLPKIFIEITPKVVSKIRRLYTYHKRAEIYWNYFFQNEDYKFYVDLTNRIAQWSKMTNFEKETFVNDAGKLTVLDNLLKKLKKEDHRVLIYSQMTKMIDLLEEFMFYRRYKYIRLDGSSKISDRRDMVADFQARSDIFVFLLSTRAGGLGINLTAADTVIFYDSDWNPTVDQQAMDRAHRLGQTKQVTVYRLICKNTIEETILQKAMEKNEMQRMVISGGDFKPEFFKSKEVVSLLLDDVELEKKCIHLIQNRPKNGEKSVKRKCDKKITKLSPTFSKKVKVTKDNKDGTTSSLQLKKTVSRKIKYRKKHVSRGRPKRTQSMPIRKSIKDKESRQTSFEYKFRSTKRTAAQSIRGPGRPRLTRKSIENLSRFKNYNSSRHSSSSSSKYRSGGRTSCSSSSSSSSSTSSRSDCSNSTSPSSISSSTSSISISSSSSSSLSSSSFSSSCCDQESINESNVVKSPNSFTSSPIESNSIRKFNTFLTNIQFSSTS